MNNQEYNQNYQNTSGDVGKRYRKEEPYDASANFDVEDSVPRQQTPSQQGYGSAPVRRQQPQGYPAQQVRRQQYPQNGSVRRQQYPQNPNPQVRRPVGYGDSYDNRYDNRYDRQRYDDSYANYNRNQRNMQNVRRRPPKKKTSGVIIAIRVIAIILLIAGVAIAGMKLYSDITDKRAHNELSALSSDFNALYAKNSDFFGWIKIEDTVVDYPVMYSPNDPELYLHTDFDGDYSESGELFMDANCDPNGYHYLIYGHHMYNGSMFGSLPKYDDVDYYNEHKKIRFDTMSEKGEYEVFAVVYSQIYNEGDDVFRYYNCANLNDEAAYNYYVSNMKALSTIDTGITPVYGEKILTLSTCNYHTDDGRFVVCARKVQ